MGETIGRGETSATLFPPTPFVESGPPALPIVVSAHAPDPQIARMDELVKPIRGSSACSSSAATIPLNARCRI
jgi:hypothetical protein